ncbi:AcrIIA2 family anti-CRISPR protein [Listeria monocytogenes]|nr:AcrIIA2 family anti-CRISPR protein [Listeria monocytogenes]MBC1250537.1 AcrIIA2 family anti-CRISPR protein [Listeria welshimeri]EHM3340809.1 AcrIIA2 family anti-CRISPR protein [Listeria monocytogenes]EHM3395849.1 AcrIIA2 family anti-CRISPR protein [Listeria monocytogenes]EJW2904756.1 AcrIIA2 family anti-CRISPR protein [Listeria monocytogenes]
MGMTTAKKKFYQAISEFEEMTGKDVEKTPQIADEVLNDADYIAFTKTEKYALALCTSDIEGFEDRYFLDGECLYSTFLETEENETYYIHFIQETEFSEEDNEDELPLATEEQIESYDKQEEQKAVILKKELN